MDIKRIVEEIKLSPNFFELINFEKDYFRCLGMAVEGLCEALDSKNEEIGFIPEVMAVSMRELIDAKMFIVKEGRCQINYAHSLIFIKKKRTKNMSEVGRKRAMSFQKKTSTKKKVKTEEETILGKKTQLAIARYIENYKFKYKSDPVFTSRDAGVMKRLAKDVPEERLIFLLDAYFEIPEMYLQKVKHPIQMFEQKINEIAAFADRGEYTSRAEVTQKERRKSSPNTLSEGFMERLKKEIEEFS